ncbi:peptidase C39 family protein [Streptomyces sp. NPDC094448]|uniref:peptidase C39 family protein n=1 Tax=Streptomyces sp. NPDC094448 TaxID=3366063 RepID=UPI0038104CF1
MPPRQEPPERPTAPERPVESLVVPYEPDALPSGLVPLVGDEVSGRWRAVDRSAHAPRLVAVPGGEGEEWTAAALVTARPHTAYLKIVDAVGDVRAAVEAVVTLADREGLAQVKWEGWTAHAEDVAATGFTGLRSPLTQPEGAAGPAAGYVRWLREGVTTTPLYYGQTTHFTCGAVTALVARAHAGTVKWQALDRQAELTLWRDATNFLACEPVGLGVAVHRARPSTPVRVHLDSDGPVLLDHYPEKDREWRALLQRASREDAERTGVPVDPDRLSLSAVRDSIGRREQVLLLLSLAGMQGFDVPHWVLCHGAVSGAIVIEDPWANATTGDTWVDAHLLPVPDSSLDLMSVLSPEGFRGAVTIGRPQERDARS